MNITNIHNSTREHDPVANIQSKLRKLCLPNFMPFCPNNYLENTLMLLKLLIINFYLILFIYFLFLLLLLLLLLLFVFIYFFFFGIGYEYFSIQ